jgi:MFS family permease
LHLRLLEATIIRLARLAHGGSLAQRDRFAKSGGRDAALQGGLGLSISGVETAAAIVSSGHAPGALFFRQLCDRFERKKLFLITLGVYSHLRS